MIFFQYKIKSVILLMCLLFCFNAIKAIGANFPSSKGVYNPLKNWIIVPDIDLEVKSGSALDFSFLANFSEINQRHLCASYTFDGPQGYFPDYDHIIRLAKQINMHGYNMVRIHFLDNALMRGAKYDFDINLEELDKFFFFIAELKKYNIKIIMDIATSRNGFYGNVGKNRWRTDLHSLKEDIYFKESSKEHWKKIADLILLTVNPYTNMKMIEEEALISLTLFNEGGLGFISSRGYSNVFIKEYNRWASASNKPIINSKNFVNRWRWDSSHKAINEFLTYKERELWYWQSQYILTLGFKGYLSSFNTGNNLQAYAARGQVSLVSMHSYPDLPTRYVKSGSRMKNVSTILSSSHFITRAAMARKFNTPFILEEYDYPYWSELRREVGLSVPAYAALQGWKSICRHGNPVALSYDSNISRQQAIFPLGVDMDPIARAGETLAALLFLRGDVKESNNLVGIKLKESDFISWKAQSAMISRNYNKIALISKVATVYPEQSCDDFDLCFNVDEQDKIKWRDIKLKLNRSFSMMPQIDDKGVEFISDTYQIYQNSEKQLLKVITPLTEAVSFNSFSSSIVLRQFSVLNSSSGAVISISSLDSNILSKSNRLLLIVATDARNTGEIRSLDGHTLIKHGRLPVWIKDVSLLMSLKRDKKTNMQLYALSLNGDRREKIPLKYSEKGVSIDIKLSELQGGPTTYFELIVDPVN